MDARRWYGIHDMPRPGNDPQPSWLRGEVVDGVRIFKWPRLVGLGVIVVSAALFVALETLIWFSGTVSVTASALLGGLVGVGLYMLVIGQPRDAEGTLRPWFKTGQLVAFGLGLPVAVHSASDLIPKGTNGSLDRIKVGQIIQLPDQTTERGQFLQNHLAGHLDLGLLI